MCYLSYKLVIAWELYRAGNCNSLVASERLAFFCQQFVLKGERHEDESFIQTNVTKQTQESLIANWIAMCNSAAFLFYGTLHNLCTSHYVNWLADDCKQSLEIFEIVACV